MNTFAHTTERGFAVPLALLVIVALGMIGGAAAFMSAGDTSVASLYASANRTSDAAAAGIEHGVGEYRERVLAYTPVAGDIEDFLLALTWPVEESIDGFAYSVDAKRDSFDFDGDGDLEPVSCKPTGNTGNNGNNGNTGNGGNGGNDGGNTGNDDNGKYWNDEGGDKDGDGEAGLAGGHFDVDVWTQEDPSDSDIKREYHQHEFDDKYDTNQADLRNDPSLLWGELFFGGEDKQDQTEYPGTVRIEFFNEDNASGTWEVKTTGGGKYSGAIGDGVTLTGVDPNDVLDFRIRFSTLLTFACTSPGDVDKDQVDRDAAYHIRMYNEDTGHMIYEWGAYWHEKEDECAEKKQQMEDQNQDEGGDSGGDDSSGGSGGSSGDSGNSGNSNNNGNNSNKPTCQLNGKDQGDPVFLLTSTATRSAYRASQRLRVTSIHGQNQVLRLSWLAD